MVIFGDMVIGEVCEVVQVYGVLVCQVCQYGMLFVVLVVLIFGGECMVMILLGLIGGCGGCCVEFLFLFGVMFEDMGDVYVFVVDIDGIDGLEDNVGVLFDFDFIVCVVVKGVVVCVVFDVYDVYGFFVVVDDLIVIGLMCINVNDYCVIFIF